MIIFYADAGWELDLTGTKITLVEENSLFHDYFVKNYSLPFITNVEKMTDDQLRFLHLDNVGLSTARYPGNLFVDNKFSRGYLTVQSVQGKNIKGIIYHGATALPVLETKLSDLPFPIVKFPSATVFAKTTASQQFPDVGFNFPMIIDEEFKSNTYYDAFEGIINKFENGNYVVNSIVNNEVLNKNVLTPFPYIMEILKVGFESAGLLINGDFVNDKANEKLIWDTSMYLESYSLASIDEHIFAASNDEYIFEGETFSEWSKTFSATVVGTYKLKILLNIPNNITIKSFKITHAGNEIYSNASYVINEELEISIPDSGSFGDIDVKLITLQNEINLTEYNKFNFETSSDKLNVYPNSFSLAQVMPDMTFGAFLNKLRKWLGLRIVPEQSIVRIDYIVNKFRETQFDDKSKYEISQPLKEPSKIKVYKLLYTEDDFILIDASGQMFDASSYTSSEIELIDMGVKTLPIGDSDGIFTAKRSEGDPDFKILMYDGLQTVSNLPLTLGEVSNRNFKLPEIFNMFHLPWYRFLLNSITITDKFECDTIEDFDINEGQYKYSQKHIYYKITKSRKSEKVYEVTCIGKTLN